MEAVAGGRRADASERLASNANVHLAETTSSGDCETAIWVLDEHGN
jgi:hypothetical protein